MPENQEAREEGCFAITFERKYYHRGGSFIKRTLRPREFRTGHRGLHIPRFRKESVMNEAESLRYIRQHTNIPVPTVHCDFEDEDAYYLVTEYVEGVSMSRLTEDQKAVVREELQGHLATLQTLKSNRLGGPSGIVIPPYRQNVIVDLDTLKINAIIDWEYAGFYPARFEWPFYTRLGPSVAGNDEVDDSLELLEFLESRSENRDGI
ncbi:kinase-like domain-containing protein [Cladorrhinum sp. PSN332]|nr:kinase-like domain-containing protein [Cladorrhinum sp. PSN332]